MGFAGHPTPTVITREFTTGYPGVLPVDSAVVSPPAAIFGQQLQVGAFFCGTMSFVIPAITAAHATTVGPQKITFAAAPTNPTWPGVFSLAAGQSAFILATIYQASPATAVQLMPTLAPSWGASWMLSGPQTFANIGANVSVVASSMAGSSQLTATFIVTALLLGVTS